MKNEITTANYAVMCIEDYSSNHGNPDCSQDDYDTLEEAQAAFDSAIAEKYSEHGKTCEVQLWNFPVDEEPVMLKSQYQESELLPTDIIIVTYQHETYMNYCYSIKGVRKAQAGERYEDLHVSKDSTYSNWDEVFENEDVLIDAYASGSSIFGKIKSGTTILNDFLNQ